MEQGMLPFFTGIGAAAIFPNLSEVGASSQSWQEQKSTPKISLLFGVYTVDPARVDTYNAQPRIWAGIDENGSA